MYYESKQSGLRYLIIFVIAFVIFGSGFIFVAYHINKVAEASQSSPK